MEDATLLEVLYLIVVSGAVMVIFKRSMSMICISISLMTILLIIIRRITRSRLPVKNKTVLITGCETEAGLELVRSLDSKGFQVLATFKSVNSNGVNILKKNCSDKLRILELDVTSDTSCRKCLNEVKSQLGENDLWAVVNNASDTLIGDVELTTIEQYKTIIDVNLLGTIRVTQTFLPLIRLSQGRIVNISSVGGLMGIPYGSAFSASKYGVEGFTESLRLEMIKFGVRVSLVEPSLSYQLSSQSSKALKQSCEEMKFKASEDILETYGEDYISGMCNEFINKNNHLNHADVCEAVTDAILLEHHTTRYIVGDSHRMLNSSKLTVLGTPAEEGGGGKIILMKHGAFKTFDVAMMAHPTPATVTKIPILARSKLMIKYIGKASHAAGFPWDGINALDAAVLCYQNISCLRQQFKPTWRAHGVITNGGVKPNIIPDQTELEYSVRAPKDSELKLLESKIVKCVESAAQATGCKVEYEFGEHPYSAMLYNNTLCELYEKNASSVGVEFSMDESVKQSPLGSTDMGNVSTVVPSIHPCFHMGTLAANHTTDFTTAAGSPAAQTFTLKQGKALALTALDIYQSPDLLQKIKQDFIADTQNA